MLACTFHVHKPFMRPHRVVLTAFFLLISVLIGGRSAAQSFIGVYRTESRITDVYSNPAYIVNDDVAQVNIAGVSFLGGNNAFKIRTSSVISQKEEFVRNQDFYKQREKFSKSGWVNLDAYGPGLAVQLMKRHHVAITTRTRFMLNADRVNNTVFQLIDSEVSEDSTILYNVNNSVFTTQLFNEVNLTYASTVREEENYVLKAGASLKLLFGVGAIGLAVPKGEFNIYNKRDVRNLDGEVIVAFTPYANKWTVTDGPNQVLNYNTGDFNLGMDLGAVYEYRPYRSIGQEKESPWFARFSFAITDIGAIKYKASTTTGTYLIQTDSQNLDRFKNTNDKTFGRQIYELTKDSILIEKSIREDFKVGLPTALRLSGEINAQGPFYMYVGALVNLRNPKTSKFASHYLTTLIFMPRLDWKNIAVSMPLTVNSRRHVTLGATLSLGPIYVGSNSLFSSALAKTVSNIDFHFGANFRIKTKYDGHYRDYRDNRFLRFRRY